MEGYRSGHNEAVLKTVWVSKPTWVQIPYLPPYWVFGKRLKPSDFDSDITLVRIQYTQPKGILTVTVLSP